MKAFRFQSSLVGAVLFLLAAVVVINVDNVDAFVTPSSSSSSLSSPSLSSSINTNSISTNIKTSNKNKNASPLYMDAGGGLDIVDAVKNAWSSYNIALEDDPLITKSITAGVILGAADFAGQAFERRQKLKQRENGEGVIDTGDAAAAAAASEAGFDVARVVRFAFFGFILQAPWNHFYYLLLDGALPPTSDPFTTTTGVKVLIDQFVQAPIFTVIIFIFLGILEGKSIASIKDQLDNDYKDTMVANWKLWVPATAINIAFCPPILRVLFLNCVFFFWSIFLSLKLNNNTEIDAVDDETNAI